MWCFVAENGSRGGRRDQCLSFERFFWFSVVWRAPLGHSSPLFGSAHVPEQYGQNHEQYGSNATISISWVTLACAMVKFHAEKFCKLMAKLFFVQTLRTRRLSGQEHSLQWRTCRKRSRPTIVGRDPQNSMKPPLCLHKFGELVRMQKFILLVLEFVTPKRCPVSPHIEFWPFLGPPSPLTFHNVENHGGRSAEGVPRRIANRIKTTKEDTGGVTTIQAVHGCVWVFMGCLYLLK